MIRTWAGSGAAKVSVLPSVCTEDRCAALCTVRVRQLYIKEAGDNAECAVSHSWEAAGRGAESDMRVSNGDNIDPEPGETKEHCAGPPSEYNLLLTTIHKTVITTFYSRTLV